MIHGGGVVQIHQYVEAVIITLFPCCHYDTLLLQKHHLALKMGLLITLLQRDCFPVLAEQDTCLHALPVSHHVTTDKPPAGPALQAQARAAPPECATEFSYII